MACLLTRTAYPLRYFSNKAWPDGASNARRRSLRAWRRQRPAGAHAHHRRGAANRPACLLGWHAYCAFFEDLGLTGPPCVQTIVEGIEATEDVPGRMHVIDEEQPFGVLVDSAGTPAALSRLLDDVRDLQFMPRSSSTKRATQVRRVILVIGCKGGRDEALRPLVGEVAHYKVRSIAALPVHAWYLFCTVCVPHDRFYWRNAQITRREGNRSTALLPLVGKHAQFKAGGITAPCSLTLCVLSYLLSLCPSVLPASAPAGRHKLIMWCAQAAP